MITPEALIQQLGPGTDGAVCVQRLIDNQMPTVKAKPGPKAEEEAEHEGRHTKDDDDDKDEKHAHTPYRNTKR